MFSIANKKAGDCPNFARAAEQNGAVLFAAAFLFPLVLFVALESSARAELPQTRLDAVSPPGAPQGATVEVRVSAGENIERIERLIFSDPRITATAVVETLAEGLPAQPNGMFRVVVPKDLPLGVYDVCAVGPVGVSNPRAFVVGNLPEIAEVAAHANPAEAQPLPLDTVVNGKADAANVDYYALELKKDQSIVVELSAAQIDSKLDAQLSVVDPQGSEVAHARAAAGRDIVVDFVAPQAGRYVVAVYDRLYSGGETHFYRLAARTGPYVVMAWPPVAAGGSKTQVELYGRNLPGGPPVSTAVVGGRPLEKVTVGIDFPAVGSAAAAASNTFRGASQATVDLFDYRVTRVADKDVIANSIQLASTDLPVVVEQEPNAGGTQSQTIAAPCEVVGRFDGRGDRDWYQFEARKGEPLMIEVVSQRLGLTTDPQLVIQRVTRNDKKEEQVSEVAEVDDDAGVGGPEFTTASADPTYRLNPPDAGTYRVLVRDLNDASPADARRVYRLRISPPRPNFRLIAIQNPLLTSQAGKSQPNQFGNYAEPAGLVMRRGGNVRVDVLVVRTDGFDRPLKIFAEGLPPGVEARPVVVGPAQSTAPLVLMCSDKAEPWIGAIRVMGEAVGGAKLRHEARYATAVWPNVPVRNKAGSLRVAPGRVMHTLNLSVVDEPIPAALAWDEPAATVRVARGAKVELPVKLERSKDFKAALTVTAIGPNTVFKSQPLQLAADGKSGKVVLDVQGNSPTETVAVYLVGDAKLQYRRDERGQKQIDEVHKQSVKLADEAAKKVAELEKQKQAAKTELAQAEAEAKKAQPEKAKEAADRVEVAKKKLAETEQAFAAATAQAAARAKARDLMAKRAADMAKVATPKEVVLGLASPALSIEVLATPMLLNPESATVAVKPGATAEAAVRVERVRGFNDKVPLELVVPDDRKNVKVSAPEIDKDSSVKIKIEVPQDAKPGEFRLTVRAKPKLNNQPVQVETGLTVKIE